MDAIQELENKIRETLRRAEQDESVVAIPQILEWLREHPKAPDLETAKRFLLSYQDKLSIFLLEYYVEIYAGRRALVQEPPTEKEFPASRSYEEAVSHIHTMLRVFIRYECQIKWK